MRTGLRCSATRASCGATDQRAPVADAGSQLRNTFAASVDVPRLVEAILHRMWRDGTDFQWSTKEVAV